MRIHLRLDRIVLFDLVLFEVADGDDDEPEVRDLTAEHGTPAETFGFGPPDFDSEDVPDEC